MAHGFFCVDVTKRNNKVLMGLTSKNGGIRPIILCLYDAILTKNP